MNASSKVSSPQCVVCHLLSYWVQERFQSYLITICGSTVTLLQPDNLPTALLHLKTLWHLSLWPHYHVRDVNRRFRLNICYFRIFSGQRSWTNLIYRLFFGLGILNLWSISTFFTWIGPRRENWSNVKSFSTGKNLFRKLLYPNFILIKSG